MKFTTVLPILAALALTAPAALAQDAPQSPKHHGMQMSADEMAKHHGEMCSDLYARAVGKLAALEVRLNLTAAQKQTFERWKQVKLAHAKDHAAKCADMTPPDRDASIIELHQHQIARLEDRLANLKAETPALEALVKILTPEQQQILKRAGMEAMRDHMDGMHRMMEGGHGRMMMPPMEPREHAN